MKVAKFNPWSMEVLQEIAMKLRSDPKKVRFFANRLRLRIATAKSSDEVSEHHWEWYAILTLWPPSEVIRLLEDLSDPSAPLLGRSSLVSMLSGNENAAWLCALLE